MPNVDQSTSALPSSSPKVVISIQVRSVSPTPFAVS